MSREPRGATSRPRATWSRSKPTGTAVGHCQRCHTIVEPRISTQWFVRASALAEPAIAAVRDGRIRIVPERFDKDLLRLDGEHPRLVHLAPALVGPSHPGVVLRRLRRDDRRAEAPTALCPLRQRATASRIEDVLDTWFSSGLWPFSTLGWPEQTRGPGLFLPHLGAGDGL